MPKFSVLPLLFFPMITWGDCTEHLQAWAATLHPELTLDSERAVCKVNPGNSSQVLAALPFAVNVTEDGDGDYGLDVLVADAASGKVIAHTYQGAAIESDAIRFNSLRLDTARYQLAPGIRAFGVRVSYDGSSRVNPYSSETLSLYLHDDSQLRQIMSSLEVSFSGGEWDGMCAGDFNQTERTLAVGKSVPAGFAGLRITEKSSARHSAVKGDGCEETQGNSSTETFVLNYDGSRYVVPKGLSF
ncbi:ABC-type multidrug transport system, ATPase-permease component [Pseudomonas synxantha]|uniref:ABC-type multidrug transport system, ATPase-permease component n=1 Tax=Pseudomonas synxantha TaxID=47883 RepID=A0A3G7U7H5_9PSED|nr:hypothetical protein [Pseudomonas synxantha]AZE55297.1 ABC-type multidrug transport system, ATPase-permease component [Pseudomonas synxantha]